MFDLTVKTMFFKPAVSGDDRVFNILSFFDMVLTVLDKKIEPFGSLTRTFLILDAKRP